jgi:cation transport ATPase
MTQDKTDEKAAAQTEADDQTGKKARKKKPGNWFQRTIFPVKDVTDTAKMARSMLDTIIEGEGSARQETFEQAVKRQNLGNEELHAAYKRQRIIVFVMLGISVLAIAYALNMLLTATSGTQFFISVMACMPITVLLVAAFRAAFRAWQIRNKRLGGLDVFLKSQKEWWPPSINPSHFGAAQAKKPASAKGAKTGGGPARKKASLEHKSV